MISLSTWKHGFVPNSVVYSVLQNGGAALDAVEQGARYSEEDLTCMSVGVGGIPDSEGFVSLDASIMDHDRNSGAVCFVRNYVHATSIARRIMETTSHIMLAGEGAELFAEKQGFERRDLVTNRARALYEEWRKHPHRLKVRLRRTTEGEHEYTFVLEDEKGESKEIERTFLDKPVNESHDTIGLLALDSHGKLAGACTTSGLAFKLHGRVGDSPIIGAGLYVDGSVGAAVATGNGELVMKSCSTFHVVEMMRQGLEPHVACERALDQIRRQKNLDDDMQVGIMAIRGDGLWVARSLRPGFQVAAASPQTGNLNTLLDVTRTGMQTAA